jgi:hypothetical protein
MRWLVPLSLAACGGASAPQTSASVQISLEAPKASADDVVVAQIDGRPVWGSCVAAQAAHAHVDRKAALDQCIAFELLAQAAEKRGIDRDPETVDAARTAMVSQLVATAFEAVYRTPADLGDSFDKIVEKNKWRMHRPEYRGSTFVRVAVPDRAPADAEAKARVLADAIATALANQTGLFAVDLVETAQRIAKQSGGHVEYSDYPPTDPSRLNKAYGDALYAIPEVGRISPVTRTKWGWDIVLWTGGITPREITREQLADELFPDVRRSYFNVWVGEIARDRGIAIKTDEQAIAKLSEDEPDAGAAAPPTSLGPLTKPAGKR